jgi:hypothetical protein
MKGNIFESVITVFVLKAAQPKNAYFVLADIQIGKFSLSVQKKERKEVLDLPFYFILLCLKSWTSIDPRLFSTDGATLFKRE